MMKFKKPNNIHIELSKDEAIIFFDWVSRLCENNHVNLFVDNAEEKVLWDIQSSLEKELVEPFMENYLEILSEARKKVASSNSDEG